MAISKELYERYKAMKAKKLEEQSGSASVSSSGGFKTLSAATNTEMSYASSANNNSSLTQSDSQPQYQNSETTSWTNSYSNVSASSESAYNSDTNTISSSSGSNVYQADEQTRANYNSQFQSSNFSGADSYTSSSVEKLYSGNVTSSYEQSVNNSVNVHKKYALIGFPLAHSLSEYIHMAGFKSLGMDASYELIETHPEKLVDTVKYLKNNGYSGFNVTIPLKLPITMFLDEIDASANMVNAINTVVIDSQTKFMKGYNTDAVGFGKAIPSEVELYGKTAGILGTGGAARAAITALAQRKIKNVKIYTRNIANSIDFLQYLRKTYPDIEFNSFQIERIRDLSDINILVNATPIGMSGVSAGYTPIEEPELQTLPSNAIVYDVIYNPKKTMLIKLAQKHNYKTITGMDMLIYQAVEAERIWTGRTPDFKDMKIAALENI